MAPLQGASAGQVMILCLQSAQTRCGTAGAGTGGSTTIKQAPAWLPSLPFVELWHPTSTRQHAGAGAPRS